MGAVVSHEFGPRKDLPPYVAVPPATEYGGTGYLGSQFGPFGLGSDPARGNYRVRDLMLPPGVDDRRFATRRETREVVDDPRSGSRSRSRSRRWRRTGRWP